MTALRVEDLCVGPDEPVRAAMERMTRLHSGILLVVDGEGRLVGTVTDGDIRRAIVGGGSVEGPVGGIAAKDPITASPADSVEELIQLMQATRKQAVPLVDRGGRVVGIEVLNDLMRPTTLENPAVIMAGGFGTRLRPFTEKVPKPMLRIEGKPILELIIERLVQHGVNRILVLVHYLPHVIREYFEGRVFAGRPIEFVEEHEPLGTAGGLSLVRERLDRPFFVMNGDTLIRANWRHMLSAHAEQGNEVTIGAAEYAIQIPYGVLEARDGVVTGLSEKPRKTWLTVCSTYCISPTALDGLERGQRADMPDLINGALSRGARIGYFHMSDVTRIEDLVPSHRHVWGE